MILIVWACLRRRGPSQTNVVYPPQAQPAVYLPQAQPGTYLPQQPSAYLPQVQPGTGVVYGNPYGMGQPQFIPQYPPQYPLQAHKGVISPQGYDPSSGFAPVRLPLLFLLYTSLIDTFGAHCPRVRVHHLNTSRTHSRQNRHNMKDLYYASETV